MRIPTTEEDALKWYQQALADKEFHLDIEFDQESPQCGFFEAKMARGGIMAPARLWIEQDICPVTGELLDDEVFWCEHGGKLKDPYEQWLWLAGNPISKERFEYLMARAEWARDWAKNEPEAKPFKKTDWNEVPIPKF